MKEEEPIDLDDIDFGETIRDHQSGDAVFRGRYLLKRVIGRGGMGIVWLASDQDLGVNVALKFLPELVRFDEGAVDSLKEETRRCLALSHPNIVRVHGFLLDDNHAAIAMEYIDGRSLAEMRLLQDNKVYEPESFAPWAAQLFAGLYYAHENGKIVHRDLKPKNIMVDSQDILKIMDFGIAHTVADSMLRVSMTDTSSAGNVSGTLPYMSPQQIEGHPPAISDDVYSLGATFFEMFTGKPPFYSGDILSQITDLNRRPSSVELRRSEFGVTAKPFPKNWEDMVLSCLSKEIHDRPASVREIAKQVGLLSVDDTTDLGLDVTIRGFEPSVSALAKPIRPVEPAPIAEPKRIARGLMILGGIGIATVLTAGLFWAFVDRKSAPVTTIVPSVTPKLPVVASADDSIQSAINAAEPGSTVTIQSGIYEESILLKNGVSLIGEGEVIIQCDGGIASVLTIEDSAGTEVKNITFSHTGDQSQGAGWPLVFVFSSSVVLEDCVMEKGFENGVTLTAGGESEIRNCTLRLNSKDGVRVERASSATLSGNKCIQNGRHGIIVTDTGSWASVQDCVCENNRFSGVYVHAAEAEIRRNTLTENHEAGIMLLAGSRAEILDNQSITNNQLLGIRLEGDSQALVENNIISGSRVGLGLNNVDPATQLINNKVNDNTDIGIFLAGRGGAIRVQSNESSHNGESGIVISGKDMRPVFIGNTIQGNRKYNLYYIDGASENNVEFRQAPHQ